MLLISILVGSRLPPNTALQLTGASLVAARVARPASAQLVVDPGRPPVDTWLQHGRPQLSAHPLGGVKTTDDIPEICSRASTSSSRPRKAAARRRRSFPAGALTRLDLVVGDPNQREAIVRDGNVSGEEYLGVQFKPTTGRCEAGKPRVVILQLRRTSRRSTTSASSPVQRLRCARVLESLLSGRVVECRKHAV